MNACFSEWRSIAVASSVNIEKMYFFDWIAERKDLYWMVSSTIPVALNAVLYVLMHSLVSSQNYHPACSTHRVEGLLGRWVNPPLTCHYNVCLCQACQQLSGLISCAGEIYNRLHLNDLTWASTFSRGRVSSDCALSVSEKQWRMVVGEEYRERQRKRGRKNSDVWGELKWSQVENGPHLYRSQGAKAPMFSMYVEGR